MLEKMRVLRGFGIAVLVIVFSFQLGIAQKKILTPRSPAILILKEASTTPSAAFPTQGHQAVGSWFGFAFQVCQAGVAPAACFDGQPAGSLIMTPTLTSDGLFIADDSLTLQGAPFGPHTTAHGAWVPSSPTNFIADYVFINNSYPPVQDTVAVARCRWLAQVVGANDITGYVIVYSIPTVPIIWTNLSNDGFPTFPNEALSVVTPPDTFYSDPSECKQGQTCPRIFKFHIKRVAP